MFDTEAYLQSLLETQPMRERLLEEVIDALELPPGSWGLDAGCGIGLQALMLARAVGPAGHVTGLDVAAGFLAYAAGAAERAGLAARVSFEQGDVLRPPFADGAFDWLWSADCAGYPAPQPLPLVQELARVVRPGGSLAILIYSSQQLLPGYPRLEARLNATASGIAPYRPGMGPEAHPLRTTGWLRAAGLEGVTARTFVASFHAPLGDGVRRALGSLIDMRWPSSQAELSPEDGALFQRLCRPESPDYILDLPDYYGFYTYSLFQGRVAG